MKRVLTAVLISSLVLFSLYSCKKISSTDIGSGLIPAVDNVNTFESVLDVTTDNKLFTDSTRSYYHLQALGIIANDPEFGRTDAAMYFGLITGSTSYPFPNSDSLVIDSLVLSLSYSGLYGDSSSIQQVEVREIDQAASFRNDTIYPIATPAFQTIPEVLGSKQVFYWTLNDSLAYRQGRDTVLTRNELRIALDTNFARRFINYDTTNAYKSDSAFRTYFKGFEVKVNDGASSTKNALAYFDLQNEATRMTFYFTVTSNGKKDTLSRSFAYSSLPRANLVNRTPANGYLAALENGQDNDEKLYIQTSPGSYGQLDIPGLDTLDNRVIHLAELIFDVLPSDGDNWFSRPSILFLDGINATGDTSFTVRNDYIPVNEDPGYDIETFGGLFARNRYAFNISRYIQSIVTKGQPINRLRIYAPYYTEPRYQEPNGFIQSSKLFLQLNPRLGAGRVVLGGGTHPTHKARLRIIYSRI